MVPEHPRRRSQVVQKLKGAAAHADVSTNSDPSASGTCTDTMIEVSDHVRPIKEACECVVHSVMAKCFQYWMVI